MPSEPSAGVYNVLQTMVPAAVAQVIAPYPPADLVVNPTLPEGADPWPESGELLTVPTQLEPASTTWGEGEQTRFTEVAWTPDEELAEEVTDEETEEVTVDVPENEDDVVDVEDPG